MHWLDILFTFKGRLNRMPYWITLIAIYLAPGFVMLLFYALALPLGLLEEGDAKAAGTTIWGIILLTLFAVYALFFLLWNLAIVVKRLHDRNKSGWWVLIYGIGGGLYELGLILEISALKTEDAPTALGIIVMLISLAIAIWYFVEVGFLKGTQGPNRFGPDPLGATAADASL